MNRLLPDDFEEKLKIDKDNLDIAVETNPELYAQVGKQYELAVSRMDRRESEKNGIKHKLFLVFKKKGEESSGRVTDKIIDAQVHNSEKYREAFTKYLDAKEEANLWLELREAFKMRGYALHKLVDMVMAEMAMTGSAYGENIEAVKTVKANQIKKQLNKKRRRE